MSKPYLNLFRIKYAKYQTETNVLTRFTIIDAPKFSIRNNNLIADDPIVDNQILDLSDKVDHTLVISKFLTTDHNGKQIQYILYFTTFVADIKMRPNKTYFVQFNDRTSKLVKSESKRDLTYKFSWH